MKNSDLIRLYKKNWKKFLLFTFAPTGIAALGLLFFLLFRSVSGNNDASPVINDDAISLNAQSVSLQETETESHRFSEPVSITVSMLGDCTLGTDEAFYYPTSLNAYYDVNDCLAGNVPAPNVGEGHP